MKRIYAPLFFGGGVLNPASIPDLAQWLIGYDGEFIVDKLSPLVVDPEPSLVGVNALTMTATEIEAGVETSDILPESFVVVFNAKRDAGTGSQYVFTGGIDTSARFYFRFEGGNVRAGVGSSTLLTAHADNNNWHQYAVEYNDATGTAKIYVEGSQLGPDLTGLTLNQANLARLVLGSSYGLVSPLQGQLGELRIYDTDSYATISDDNLVASWANQEGLGTDMYPSRLIQKSKLTTDGIWNQWIYPVATYHNGYTYWGVTNTDGSQWVHRRTESTGVVESKQILDLFAPDDHNAPAIYVDDTVGITIFATGHNNADVELVGKAWWGKFATWDDVVELTDVFVWDVVDSATYNQIFKLGSRYYWISRIGGITWEIVYSDNAMSTWSVPDVLATAGSTTRNYYCLDASDGEEAAIATYPRATSEAADIRFGKIIGDTVHYNATTSELIDGSLPDTVWETWDLVYDAGAGEYLRLVDIAKFNGVNYILFIIHDNAGQGVAQGSYFVASGDFGNWTIVDTGIDVGDDVGYTTYFGIGSFDKAASVPSMWIADYTIIGDTSTITRYELDGTWTDVGTVLSASDVRARPKFVENSTGISPLWDAITGYATYNTFVGWIEDQNGGDVAASWTVGEHTETLPTWTTVDGYPSRNHSGGFYNNSGQNVPSLISTPSLAANGLAITNPGCANNYAVHNGSECGLVISNYFDGWVNMYNPTGAAKISPFYWSDYFAHESSVGNGWIKWRNETGPCIVKEAFQYKELYVPTLADHNKNARYVGAGGGCGSIAPFDFSFDFSDEDNSANIASIT